jgi:hypothetical protein
MKHHPKYRTHKPGHPERGESVRRPESLGRSIEHTIRSSINAMQRKGVVPRGATSGRKPGRRGQS